MGETRVHKRMHDSGEEPFFYLIHRSPSASKIWERIVKQLQERKEAERKAKMEKGGSN